MFAAADAAVVAEACVAVVVVVVEFAAVGDSRRSSRR